MTPGQHGITMVIDTGLPTGAFTDVIESHGSLIDVVKFGWGTALVTRDMDRKAAVLREAGIDFYFGGTLFEYYVWTGQLVDYLALVERFGATHIEVSNGTIPLDQNGKADYVRRLAGVRPGAVRGRLQGRGPVRAAHPGRLGRRAEPGPGGRRHPGHHRGPGERHAVGIAGADGQHAQDRGARRPARGADRGPTVLLFEAPTKALQTQLIGTASAPTVNLGNIATGRRRSGWRPCACGLRSRHADRTSTTGAGAGFVGPRRRDPSSFRQSPPVCRSRSRPAVRTTGESERYARHRKDACPPRRSPPRDLDEALRLLRRSAWAAKLARRYADRITLDFFGDQLVCHLSDDIPLSRSCIHVTSGSASRKLRTSTGCSGWSSTANCGS